MKKKRNAYEENKRELAEKKVVDYLKTVHWVLEAENVYIYASYGSEFDADPARRGGHLRQRASGGEVRRKRARLQ